MRKQMYSKTFSLLSVFLMLGLLGTGCGGGGTTNNCDGVANSCVTADASKCNTANTGIQTCQANVDGCLVWTDSMTCGERQTCDTSGADVACRCNIECTTSGETQCSTTNTTVIQTCTADNHGCLYWADGTDCADTSQFCDDANEPAVCSTTCTNQCTAGETQCNGTIIQGCAMVGTCTDWVDGTDCNDNGLLCNDLAEPATCVATCTNECDTVDATQCNGEVIETCTLNNTTGCNEWVAGTNCADNSEFCVITGGDAVCSATCEHRCDTEGASQCDDQTVQVCTLVGDCRDWVDGDTCVPPRFECEVVATVAQCVEQCSDECDPAVDASQCDGNTVQTCTMDNDTGCYEWLDTTACADPTPFCDNTQDPAVCIDTCTDECDTLNERRCNAAGTGVETCTEGGDGCNDWVVTIDCTENSQVCYDYTGSAVCADPCTDDCDLADLDQCNGTVIETCEAQTDTDGCNDWVTVSDCADTPATPACDDQGGTAAAACVCADECEAGTDLDYCDGNVITTCGEANDGDTCTEWVAGQDCADLAATPLCDDGSGTVAAACVCADDCALADPNYCDGNLIMNCEEQVDGDGCNDWVVAQDCEETSQFCDSQADPVECADTCTNDCEMTEVDYCDGTIIMTCGEADDGDSCYEWVVLSDCVDTPATPLCDDGAVGDDAVCVCEDECMVEGYEMCNNTVITTCTMGGDMCLDWIAGTDCADGGQACMEDQGSASCVAACQELVNQPWDPDGGGLADQNFETASDAYDIFIADDIVAASDWSISMIYVPGTCWNGGTTLANANTLNFEIYADNAGQPAGIPVYGGVPVWSVSLTPDDSQLTFLDGTGSGTACSVYLLLDTPASLPAGTYWFAFYPEMEFGVGGQFGWQPALSTTGYDAMVANPGAGFGFPTTWTAITDPSTWALPNGDMAFELWTGPSCCINECTDGDSYCDGTIPNTCAVGASGCTEWQAAADCLDTNQECQMVGDPAMATCVDCTDECMAVDDEQCNGSVIQICVTGPDTCLDWQDVTDCSENDPIQYCDDSGASPVCADLGMFVGGADCGSAVPLDIPANLPTLNEETNCGMGNNYSDTCLGNYDGGEDIIYNLNVTEESLVAFIAGSADTTYWGVALSPSCPPGADDCIVSHGESTANIFIFGCYRLAPGPYSVMFDTWPTPDCIATLTFSLDNFCECATGETSCADADTADTCDVWGQWGQALTPCPAGCGDIGGGVMGCLPECTLGETRCTDSNTSGTCDANGFWVDASCPNGCADIGGGEYRCTTTCPGGETPLYANAAWTVGDVQTADGNWYCFAGTAGETYYVWWDDSYQGSGTYSGDLDVTGFQEDGSTSYFGPTDSGYNTPQAVTVVDGEDTVLIQARPYAGSSTYYGTYGIMVTSQ
jgi:hypothetical protein